jgi:hypothetical protein
MHLCALTCGNSGINGHACRLHDAHVLTAAALRHAAMPCVNTMHTQLYAKYQQAVHGDTPDECDKGHFERYYIMYLSTM